MLIDNASFRYHEFLRQYWDGIRGNRTFPLLNEVDVNAVKEVWPYCFVVEVDNDTYRYQYLGAELTPISIQDGTQPHIARAFGNNSVQMIEKFSEVVTRQKPLIEKSEFSNSAGQIIRYRMCLLPMGNEFNHVGYIMGCVRWKTFDEGGAPSSKTFDWDSSVVR